MKRLVLVCAGGFFVLTALAAATWWVLVVRRLPEFPTEHIGKVIAFLVGSALVQLLSLVLVFRLIKEARSADFLGFSWLTFFASALVLFGNALYFFTPAIGAPIVLFVSAGAFVTTRLHRSRHPMQSSSG